MKAKNGEDAFPNDEENRGMGLRDYFAAKALQGLCSNQEWMEAAAGKARQIGVRPDQCVALASYEMADAMLAARGV